MNISYLLLLSYLLQCSGAFTPIVYGGSSHSMQCGDSDLLHDVQLMDIIKTIQHEIAPPGCNHDNLPQSCSDILRCSKSASSGYYQIQAANGSAVQVYCDMEGTNCGGEGGWTRVAYLNMTDPSSLCPAGFRIETASNVRFCIRDTNGPGCRSMTIQQLGLNYTHVCGYARGYQLGSTDGFGHPGIIEGISIKAGTTHVWAYASGVQEAKRNPYRYSCPCNTNSAFTTPPSVGNDYYCESGILINELANYWFTDDPLWDGKQCGGSEEPCCIHNGMPWFNKTLPLTTATINAKICVNEYDTTENIGVDRFVLFVK